ncbi:MAG: hypothetical protein ABI415_03180 [Flavitalea sp.]
MATDNSIRSELREISPSLAEPPLVNPFSLPAGYFEELAEQVLRRIRTDEAQTPSEEIGILSPLLGGLKHKSTFTMPVGYMEQLTAETLETAGNDSKTRVVPMFFLGRTARFAAAAVVIGILATGAWFFTSHKRTDGSLAQTNEVTNNNQIRSQVDAISDAEMVNYLDSNLTITSMEAANSTDDIKQDDIEVLLADISDQELEHYLSNVDPRAEKLN